MDEHPIERPIRSIQIDAIHGAGPDGDGNTYFVGDSGVTRIEACTKSGMHANIPYLRVWADDRCVAEFCQHQIVGVYFGEPLAHEDEAARCKRLDLPNYVDGQCTTCELPVPDCDCIPF